MAIDKKSFKKLFPNLYREIEELDECKVPINAVRADPEAAEKAIEEEEEILEPTVLPDKFRHFPQRLNHILLFSYLLIYSAYSASFDRAKAALLASA